MRAFLDDLDREVALAAIAGIMIGLIWLAWTGPGFVLAWSALVAGVITWILRRRWLEVGVLLVAAGAVPAIGYRLFGPPAIPATVTDVIPVEEFAPGAADLLVVTGLLSLALVTIVAIREFRRRERRIEAKEARRQARLREGA